MLPSIFILFSALAQISHGTYLMYLTGQHNVIPEKALVSGITHVALAFMQSSIFNELDRAEWPLFTTVETVRTRFEKNTSILVAIGGWGDTKGFSVAAATPESRKLFAQNVKQMVDFTGADGVDIDWEYPGGNGEDYKQIPNSEKAWEIDAYPKLLSEIRSVLGPDKLISAAVPGLRRDMLAFTMKTVPEIDKSLDFWNIMTYDLMNRRDNITKHHSGAKVSLDGINAYLTNGVPPEKVNLGFGFYVKWYKTDPEGGCQAHPVGCKTLLMEDPVTGADLSRAAAFSWHDEVPIKLEESFNKAMADPQYDEEGGGTYYWDAKENIFWSWDDEYAIQRKVPFVKERKGLGGAFAWGLGEDAPAWNHLRALDNALRWEEKILKAGYQAFGEQEIFQAMT
ncbi:42 kDa endochitinase-like protein [Bisporella sp. PMI_857]|nr:42 kDa endochitinase-like protein [Bisporella sp. PMI_857]